MKRKSENMPVGSSSNQPEKSSSSDISRFLETASELKQEGLGRLVFAMDATMSRQPTWDRACNIQSSMFHKAGNKTGLAVQLVYFRGHGECRASRWVSNPEALGDLMTRIDCRGGITQIGKVLRHTIRETGKKKVSALVFIGDAMEENVDQLCEQAGKLGVHGVKTFMFQEGADPQTEMAFREIARLTNGAYMRLNNNSAKELEELLSAVAAFASGGLKALQSQKNSSSRLLLEQLGR
ncbi:MAG: VWA domain-containing protein [Rhizobiaceae bacterium]|nr:VWA domain-containing protein [Rhizobiaceae bacterium]